jgi:hypothetical protein
MKNAGLALCPFAITKPKNLHQRSFYMKRKAKELYQEVTVDPNFPSKHGAIQTLGISTYYNCTNQTTKSSKFLHNSFE